MKPDLLPLREQCLMGQESSTFTSSCDKDLQDGITEKAHRRAPNPEIEGVKGRLCHFKFMVFNSSGVPGTTWQSSVVV